MVIGLGAGSVIRDRSVPPPCATRCRGPMGREGGMGAGAGGPGGGRRTRAEAEEDDRGHGGIDSNN